jgi:hypothetical protein
VDRRRVRVLPGSGGQRAPAGVVRRGRAGGRAHGRANRDRVPSIAERSHGMAPAPRAAVGRIVDPDAAVPLRGATGARRDAARCRASIRARRRRPSDGARGRRSGAGSCTTSSGPARLSRM